MPKMRDIAEKTGLNISTVSRALREAPDISSETVRLVKRTAMQMVSTPSKGWGGKAADSFFTYLRTNTGLQMMVANVTNTLQQFTGLSISA